MNKLIVLKAMKKILILTILFIILSARVLFSPLFGHPVWGEKIILTQPNGTKIVGYIYGDEFHRRIETKQGYTMILNEETGTIEYAVLENNKLVPSGMVVGEVKPFYLEQINLPKHLSDRKFKIAEIRRKSPEKLHDRLQPRPETKGVKIQALEGTKKVFVVCVQFQPEASPPTGWHTGNYSPSGFNTRLFSTGASDVSMANYFKSNSYNKFWPEGYTYPNWVTLPQTATWYKNEDSWRLVIIDAMDEIRNVEPTFDFTQYATAGDIDMIIVWAGTYEDWGDFFWPKMGQATVIRYGVRVKFFNAVNERHVSGIENTDISVFCHEYGHMTGCPDLYDYSSFHLVPIGKFCIMGTSDYRTNFCGYIKWRNYEWVTPEEIFSDGTYSTDALALASVSNPRLHKIDIDPPYEYLLLENRYNGADANYENLTGRRNGLLITHIDENYPPAQGMPDDIFYGVEAIVPALDPTITTLEEYENYYNLMVFASEHGYAQLGPASPDDRPAGDYLTLTSGDDTEHVIYRNTQGHVNTTNIDISSIGASGQTMSFTVAMPSSSPTISGSITTPTGQGISGVTVNFTGGFGPAITDASGNYSQSVPSGWSGTATPLKTGSIFEPPNRSYWTVTSSQIEQDYFGEISLITGNVTDGVGTGVEDVLVVAYSSGGSYLTSAYTDINGNFVIGGLSTAGYKIHYDTRYAAGMRAAEWYNNKDSFGAADLVWVTEGSTISGIDAVLTSGGGIKGRVTNSAGVGIQSVIAYAYTPTGGFVSYDFTDSNGDYEIISIMSGNYKIFYSTSSAIGDYIEEWYNDKDSIGNADSVPVTEGNITSGIDAVLAAITPMISGAVKDSAGTGIQGVTITFSNAGGTTTTDSSGNYFHNVPDGWSGRATPAKAGYTFSPPYIDYTSVTSDQTNQDYIGTILTYTISGNVSTTTVAASVRMQQAGLSGVVMNGLPGNPTTDASGNYSATANYGFTGTVTPTLVGYTFSPSSRDYTNVTSDQTDHNYTATRTQHTLTIAAGSGGTTNPVPGTYTHDYGTQVQVTAEPNDGYQFNGWTGDVPSGDENDNPVTITMDADKSITATFIVIPDGTEDGDGGGQKKTCFIATAAYGSQLHPHLDILRDFRDKYLISNGIGRKLVELYYKYSPSIADFIAKHTLLKVAVRINLLPLIAFSYSMINFGPVLSVVMLIFIFVIPILLISFKKRKQA